MKKFILILCLVILSAAAFAQQGLDGIIVEKYYKTNASDHAADPDLAEGAVTYRIFIDMKDGWQLQSVYGSPDNNQEMRFQTSAPSFYNNTAGGAFGNDLSYSGLSSGLSMLDSYITLGAAAKKSGTNHFFGIPKLDDNTGTQISHSDGLLQNTAGYPAPFLSIKDGIITVTTPASAVPSTSPGLGALTDLLDGTTSGNLFASTQQSYFSTAVITGPNTDNKVLIGQFTTEGVFTFKINVQIRRISDNLVEQYVNSNPGANMFLRTDFSQTLGQPATPPDVTGLTVNPVSLIVGGTVNMSVTANDNVSVDSVVFYSGSVRVGKSLDAVNPYTYAFNTNAVGTFSITARAYDNEATETISAPPVSLTVLPVPANLVPIVDILTVPALPVNVNSVINGSATAHDPDPAGSIQHIQFYVNNIPVGSPDNNPPYEFTYTAPATEQILTIKAVATDNQGGRSADKTAQVTVTDPTGGYKILSQKVTCNNSDFFYVPVATKGSGIANVIGFDMVMTFNSAKVRPTRVIRVNKDLIADSLWTSSITRVVGDSIYISLFLNSTAPAGTYFGYTGHNTGKVLRVEFAKTTAFQPNDSVVFNVPSFVESYNTQTSLNKAVNEGYYVTYAEKYFTGKLMFWADDSPIVYTGSTSTSLITNIFNWAHTYSVQPDEVKGEFVYDITKGLSIDIDRDILDTTDVMSAVNGFDAYLTQKVLVDDPSFKPNVYQIMSMDVNLDGKVSAGDVSQINQRTVESIAEFKQRWNYEDDGDKKPGMGASLDWGFFDDAMWVNNVTRISTKYPLPDALGGYYKNNVYQWGRQRILPVENENSCPIIYNNAEYRGIMLGDVNGNYKNIAPLSTPGVKGSKSADSDKKAASAQSAEATGKVVFDLSKATVNDGYITFPITISSESNVNALDFSMKFDLSKLAFKSVFNHSNNLQSLAYYNEKDQTLRVTSFSLQNYAKEAAIVSLRFELKNENISGDELSAIKAYINGEPAQVELEKLAISSAEITEKVVRIFPVPARNVINVELSENADIDLLDMNGKVIRTIKNVNAYQKHEINVESLPQGMYLMKIYMKIGNDQFLTTRKVVIKR
jgi:hypothetical protein